MKDKEQSIETLRGIAILLVVAGYIIKDDLSHVESVASFLEYTYYFLKPIRMPLFTVISAYLYASSPATQATFKKLVTGKARRILIPYFVVSAMQYIFFSVFHVHGPHELQHILKIYLWPFEQFWFLWAIFLIFIGIGILDSINALDTKKKCLGWIMTLIPFYIFLDLPRFLAARGIAYLIPFFIMGYCIRRFSKDLFTPTMLRVYVASLFLSYPAYLHLYSPTATFEEPMYKILMLWVTFSALPLIFHFRPTIPVLAKIGYYAFGIHIFNKIAMLLPKMAFEHFHIYNDILIMVTYLGVGIFLSIVISDILERHNFTRFFILGMKEIPKSIFAAAAPPLLSAPSQSVVPVVSSAEQKT